MLKQVEFDTDAITCTLQLHTIILDEPHNDRGEAFTTEGMMDKVMEREKS